MAEQLIEGTIDTELYFSSKENEIIELFEKLFTSIEDKRKSILGIFDRIRYEYKQNNDNRLQRLSELKRFKERLNNIANKEKLNHIMEISEDMVHNIEARMSELIIPDNCPHISLQCEHLDSILAKIDMIQLITSTDEATFENTQAMESLDSYIHNISENIKKIPLQFLDTERRKSLIRHVKLQSTSQVRPITDIKIVSNKSTIPVGYTALDSTAGGKEVDLWENLKLRIFSAKPKRYLCYTRQTMDALSIKEGTSKRSLHEIPESDQIVVTDIRVISSTTSEFIPLDYEVVDRTVDQNELALSSHNLLVKYEKKLQTENAVSQIMFLGQAQVDCLPPKFSSVKLPINSHYICFNSDLFHDGSCESFEVASPTSP
ncbi:Multivesicular body subunit 12B-like [Oopsacas minuta]|uniref:Multivesicular body subunit 12B-like n=1 Tax=Oopsacas minuta TaxID=111878 RepID=A0AAV7JPL4_9METZ|nr:Multivesicular body subunit 12B-like [Oopsacas minuta]